MGRLVEGLDAAVIVADVHDDGASAHGSYHLAVDHELRGVLRPSHTVDYQICGGDLLCQIISVGNDGVDLSVVFGADLSQRADVDVRHGNPCAHGLQHLDSASTHGSRAADQSFDPPVSYTHLNS